VDLISPHSLSDVRGADALPLGCFVVPVITAAFGGVVYVASAYLLRINELQEVLAFLRARFRRAPVVAEGA
jgi:hypothetical protein